MQLENACTLTTRMSTSVAATMIPQNLIAVINFRRLSGLATGYKTECQANVNTLSIVDTLHRLVISLVVATRDYKMLPGASH